MLFLWLWHPEFSRAAARGLCTVINVPGSAVPDLNECKDQFMVRAFQNNADVVRKLWSQYQMQDLEVVDVVKMSHTDNSGKSQKDLAAAYPHYDYFLFIKYAALCTANHYIEGTFSNQVSNPRTKIPPISSTYTHPYIYVPHQGTLHRINMSDARLDRDTRYKQNIEHCIHREVVVQAKSRRALKGCSSKIRYSLVSVTHPHNDTHT